MFESETLIALITIIGIDLVLAGDNAVIIGMASRNLPKEQRKKAIFYGTLVAILIRVALTFIAIQLLNIPFLMAIGGLLLVYVAIKLIVGERQKGEIGNPQNLIAAIRTIVIADLIMGVDNVLAVAGASRGNFVLILIGLAISIPIIIFASQLISNLMNKYPYLVYIGAAIIAYTAAVMFLQDPIVQQYIPGQFNIVITIVTIAFALAVGWWRSKNRQPSLRQKAR